MKLSWIRAIQWIGIFAVLVFVVALRYEAPSEAGMQMNAPPESSLSQSLRGYWKLDDGSGTNATDSSGNSNTLAMTGSPSWTTGNIGPYALDFSGTGQYLSVADPSSGVLDFVDGADFSISGWFNRDTFTADHTIVAKKTNQTTNAGYVVWIDASTDTVNFEISDGTDTYEADSATAFTATGWHHFVAVWDDSNGAYVYIDGGLNGSTTSSTSSIGDLSNANAFRIGAESDDDNPFDGKLDDIRIYGYALSADQVKKLYNTTAPTQPVDTSLVGHWTFDGADIQGTTAIDRSSYGNNGTITGATKTIGKLGQALSFNGSGDIVDAGLRQSLTNIKSQGGGGETYSLWIYPSVVQGRILIGRTDYISLNNTNSISYTHPCTAGSVFRETIDSLINVDQWNFIAVTAPDSVFGTDAHIYINGTEAAYKLYYEDGTGSILPDGTYPDQSFVIGGFWYNPSFNGAIDDVRVYNRILPGAEILNSYNRGR